VYNFRVEKMARSRRLKWQPFSYLLNLRFLILRFLNLGFLNLGFLNLHFLNLCFLNLHFLKLHFLNRIGSRSRFYGTILAGIYELPGTLLSTKNFFYCSKSNISIFIYLVFRYNVVKKDIKRVFLYRGAIIPHQSPVLKTMLQARPQLARLRTI
jgi:hypothetical protein